MTWSTPWAWAGLALLALPVLIHLLHRAPATRQQFPTLRFIDESRLPPRRRRRLHDVPVLLVRMAAVAAAVVALAGPMLGAGARTTPSRQIARAIVLDTSGSMRRTLRGSTTMAIDSGSQIASALSRDGVTALAVRSAFPQRALRSAIAWLATQRGTREVVIVSDFQRGTVDARDIASIPRAYGVRLVALEPEPLPTAYEAAAVFPAASVRVRLPLARGNDGDDSATEFAWQPERGPSDTDLRASIEYNSFEVHIDVGDRDHQLAATVAQATIGDAATARLVIADTAAAAMNPSAHRVRLIYASSADYTSLLAQAYAPRSVASVWAIDLLSQLSRNASLVEAARSTRASQSAPAPDSLLVIARDANGEPLLSAGVLDRDSSLTLFVRADASSIVSAALIAALDRASIPARDFADRDPVEIDRRTLAAWNRAPLDSTATTVNVSREQSGELASLARWLWLVALLLLGLETVMRRRADARRVPETAT